MPPRIVAPERVGHLDRQRQRDGAFSAINHVCQVSVSNTRSINAIKVRREFENATPFRLCSSHSVAPGCVGRPDRQRQRDGATRLSSCSNTRFKYAFQIRV